MLLIALMAIESIRLGLSVFAFSQHRFIAWIFVAAGGLQGVGRYGSVAWLELLGAFS